MSQGVNPLGPLVDLDARQIAKPIAEFTDNQLAVQCFAHVHCAILTLRRCLLSVNYRNSETGARQQLGTCQRPAVVREGDVYSCDACSVCLHNADAGVELPHAPVVRRYNTFIASGEMLARMAPKDAVSLAFELVAALPPCPHTSVDFEYLKTLKAQPFLRAADRLKMVMASVAVTDERAWTEICPRCSAVVTDPRALTDLDWWISVIREDACRRWTGAL